MKTKTLTVSPPSKEELKMVEMLADGKSGADIAEVLGVTINKISFDLTVLRSKYDCDNSTELVAYFLRNKLID